MTVIHTRYADAASAPSAGILRTRPAIGASTPTSGVLHTRGAGTTGPPSDVPPDVAFALPSASTGIAKSAIPTNTAIASTSATAAQGIYDQATMSGDLSAGAWAPPALNINYFSGVNRTIGFGDHPNVKIKVTAGTTTMAWLGDAGVPIPADFVPEGGSDSQLFLYCPDDNRGPSDSWEGTYWEFFGIQALTESANPTDWAAGYRWECYQLGRTVNAKNYDGRQSDIYYQVGANWGEPASDPYAWAGATQGSNTATPDQIRAAGGDPTRGVYQEGSWGALAIGASPPGALLQIHADDILRGYCDHPLGLVICNCEIGYVWPAQRGDGTWSGYPLIEGNWLRFPYNATMPTNLHPLGEVMWRTARAYEGGATKAGGILICDKTAVCLAVRMDPAAGDMLTNPGHDGRNWTGDPFANWPWASLQLMTVGSDANYHPTS